MNLSADLWKRLILPLGIVALATFVVGIFVPWQGLFISLSVTSFGIIVTVGYVDYVLRRNEKLRWASVDILLREHLQQFATVSIAQFRPLFGVSPDVLHLEAHDLITAREVARTEAIRLAESILIPLTPTAVGRLDQDEWKQLIHNMQTVLQLADWLITSVGHRLEPEYLHAILAIRAKATDILGFYATFPDLLGVPDFQLPHSTGVPATTVKRTYNDMTTMAIQELMATASQLLKQLKSQ
jgi:hypothetical protein